MSEADLEKLDGITDGTAAANKAVVLDGSKNIATIGTVGCGAITSTGNSSFAQGTFSGRVIVDDSTDATSTTDGSLQTDGGLSVAKDAVLGNDVKLLSDSAVLSFGADSDTTLTHTDGSGLTLNGANKIMFNDASQFIHASSATILELGATDEIGLTATSVDMDANLDLDGTANISGLLSIQTGIAPQADDGAYLGTSDIGWSDLFLAEGGVINWDDGDMTITQASNVMTIAGGTLTATLTNALACDTSESGLDGTDYDGSAGVTNWKVDLNDLGAAAVDVAADSIAIIDANASSATKKESIADLVSAMAGNGLTATNGVLSADAAGTPTAAVYGTRLSEGFNYLTGTLAGAMIVSLPEAGSGPTVGDVYYLKTGAGVDGTRTVTIACSGAHSIDGVSSIVLESPYAAVSLVYMASGSWSLF
jgi:hypothetical protein